MSLFLMPCFKYYTNKDAESMCFDTGTQMDSNNFEFVGETSTNLNFNTQREREPSV